MWDWIHDRIKIQIFLYYHFGSSLSRNYLSILCNDIHTFNVLTTVWLFTYRFVFVMWMWQLGTWCFRDFVFCICMFRTVFNKVCGDNTYNNGPWCPQQCTHLVDPAKGSNAKFWRCSSLFFDNDQGIHSKAKIRTPWDQRSSCGPMNGPIFWNNIRIVRATRIVNKTASRIAVVIKNSIVKRITNKMENRKSNK